MVVDNVAPPSPVACPLTSCSPSRDSVTGAEHATAPSPAQTKVTVASELVHLTPPAPEEVETAAAIATPPGAACVTGTAAPPIVMVAVRAALAMLASTVYRTRPTPRTMTDRSATCVAIASLLRARGYNAASASSPSYHDSPTSSRPNTIGP